MDILVAIVTFIILIIIQTGIVSRIPLLHGTADLVMLAIIAWGLQKRAASLWAWGIIGALLVGYVTAVPVIVYVTGYLVVVGLVLVFRQRAINVPVLTMLMATFLGTLIVHSFTLLTLRMLNRPLPLLVSINQIVLPSLLLNMILALPFFFIFKDMVALLHPEPLEV